MPLINPCSPRAVRSLPNCPLIQPIVGNIPRPVTFELGYVRKCACKTIFHYLFIFVCMCGPACYASLAMTCNTCIIDCDFGQYHTQYTPSRLHHSGVYKTVLPSPQSIIQKYRASCAVLQNLGSADSAHCSNLLNHYLQITQLDSRISLQSGNLDWSVDCRKHSYSSCCSSKTSVFAIKIVSLHR